ncbi:hypothetical protein RGQ30_00390 [Limnobacter thiooxidans]|uniref:DUF2946 domain-containing protein n=2 Tax=Burkholderiaceae TaxID=119060 RepID=A0AA86MAB2_9BURK|nr:hypothetical protein RGQ30_00390 [Limnobacter thiooxidans]
MQFTDVLIFMNSRWFQHMLIALALLAAQWAGLAHSIEHREQLQHGAQSHTSVHGDAHISADLLHSCLLFDGLTTAHAATPAYPATCALPLQATLTARSIELVPPRNTLFAQRVRVRDPPRFS